MKKIIDLVADELAEAFEKAGYDRSYAKVTLSINVTALWRGQRHIRRRRS